MNPEGSSSAAAVRRRDLAAPLRAFLAGAGSVAAVGVLLGIAFAGSPARIAEGVHIAGVDVGGLTAPEARTLLEARFEPLRATPVTFVAGSRRFELTPAQLGVEVEWAAAVEVARREGEGFAPVRGLRRISTRIFGADIAPPAAVSEASLTYAIGEIAKQVDRAPREPALRFQGVQPVVVPGGAGRSLDREATEGIVVRALSAFTRTTVALPVEVTSPKLAAEDLEPALAQARVAVSAPVRVELGQTRWRLPRPRLASMIVLPENGQTELSIGGAQTQRFLDRVVEVLGRGPVDAGFAVRPDGSVRVTPGIYGREIDRDATARAILRAATSESSRVATVQARSVAPARSTAEAKAMGITGTLGAYTTAYSGTADRIHNLQLAISLLDGTLVPPGGTFSLNEAVGERTAERGFRVAPVIVGGEYEEAVGGGVSQVATTIFNAAWEAGLKIAERNPHALYIGRYPLGRDATVHYPSLDLKFTNDTPKWILVRGWSGGSGITVALYGSPTGRRVVSEAGSLTETGPAPVERTADPTLPRGQTVVEEEGQPARSVAVTRRVYKPNGELLYDETWRTSYRAEKRVVRVGTKTEPKPRPEPSATTRPPAASPPRP